MALGFLVSNYFIVVIATAVVVAATASANNNSNSSSSNSSTATNSSDSLKNCTGTVVIPTFTPVGDDIVMTFAVYGMPLLCVIGMIGNVISFVILKESALRTSSHFYLCSLSVSDFIALLSLLPTMWTIVFLKPYLHIIGEPGVTWIERYLMRPGLCEVRLFFTFFFRTTSIWLVVLFSVERALCLSYPLHVDRWCTVRRAQYNVLLLIVVALLANCPWFFAFTKYTLPCPEEIRSICHPNVVLLVNRFVEFAFLTILPAFIVAVCNCIIIYLLRLRSKTMQYFNSEVHLKQQRSITRRLLAISISFSVLTLPSMIVVTYQSYKQYLGETYNSRFWSNAFVISLLMWSMNLAINFIMYILTGKNFRLAAISMLCCRIEKMKIYRRAIIQPRSTTQNYTRSSAVSSCKTNRNAVESNSTGVHVLKDYNDILILQVDEEVLDADPSFPDLSNHVIQDDDDSFEDFQPKVTFI